MLSRADVVLMRSNFLLYIRSAATHHRMAIINLLKEIFLSSYLNKKLFFSFLSYYLIVVNLLRDGHHNFLVLGDGG